MSDDRFEDKANTYRAMPKQKWDGLTLEEAVKLAITRGAEAEIAMLIRLLPDESKTKYRQLWKELKRGRA